MNYSLFCFFFRFYLIRVWFRCYFFNIDIEFWFVINVCNLIFIIAFSSSLINNRFHRPSSVALWYPICSLLNDICFWKFLLSFGTQLSQLSVGELGRNIACLRTLTSLVVWSKHHLLLKLLIVQKVSNPGWPFLATISKNHIWSHTGHNNFSYMILLWLPRSPYMILIWHPRIQYGELCVLSTPIQS